MVCAGLEFQAASQSMVAQRFPYFDVSIGKDIREAFLGRKIISL